MAKRKHRSVSVHSVDRERLLERLDRRPVVVGVDVAKVKQFAVVMAPDGSVAQTVRWEQPHEQDNFVGFVLWLSKECPSLTVGMEPSGVYGDTMRHALLEQGIDVVRVSPKRTHDMAEVYDGVPSRHDAKAAAIVAKLHLDGGPLLDPEKVERVLDVARRTVGVPMIDEELELVRVAATVGDSPPLRRLRLDGPSTSSPRPRSELRTLVSRPSR